MSEKRMNFLRARIKAFSDAGRGIYDLFHGEVHAKIHLFATVCVLIAGILCHISAPEWCVIIICIGGVLTAEGFNTAIEKLADKIECRYDPLIGKVKDIAAGAVLLFVMAAVAVGLIIFLPKFLS
ncbi:MAG: diacylglycerol kinase family protein [Candidatus Amulumruptor caecigallinarius]|nr:diacylglycerol kinase family protein [Candidatus Amulumruptor caecigallinarius]